MTPVPADTALTRHGVDAASLARHSADAASLARHSADAASLARHSADAASLARHSADAASLARHGDDDVRPGMLDFAVNVRCAAPDWMRAQLSDRIVDLATYPSRADMDRAVAAMASTHGRDRTGVLPLAGAAEGFALLAAIRPRLVAVVAPSFTEPERVLRSARIPVARVMLPFPWRLSDADVPDAADVVVLGNPTNPTSVLHSRAEIEALRRPGRLVVVDEAFADITLAADAAGHIVHEPESLSSWAADDLVVIRSVTKTFGLAGLRAGYLLAAPAVIAALTAGRPHWPVGTLQLSAIALALGPRGRHHARTQARKVVEERDAMLARLADAGVEVCGSPAASFVLTRVPDGAQIRRVLADRGVAVRGCDSFPGLTSDHIRLAVREHDAVTALLDAWESARSALSAQASTALCSAAPSSTAPAPTTGTSA